MQKIFFALLLISCLQLKGQLSAQKILYDTINSTAIPFAIISHPPYEKGFYADSSGYFEIDTNIDSILVSCIGYGSRKFKLDKNNDTLFLNPTRNLLHEVVVYSDDRNRSENVKREEIGFTKKSRISITMPHGWEVAALIKPQTSDIVKLIEGLIVQIKNTKNQPLFRVHFYANDEGRPGQEIIFPNKIIKSPTRLGKSVEINNLDSYGITVPSEGLFVSFESLKVDNSERPEFILTDKYAVENTFCRSKLANNSWHTFYESGLSRLVSKSKELNLCLSLIISSH